MPEWLFRYVRCERAAAWKAAGWTVISGPLELKPPPELEGPARPYDDRGMGTSRASSRADRLAELAQSM
jgi:hypothetical protein